MTDEGVLVNICEHNVKHPNEEWLHYQDIAHRCFIEHMCDGCCKRRNDSDDE